MPGIRPGANAIESMAASYAPEGWLDLGDAFEARAFSGRGEFRWLRDNVGAGTGVTSVPGIRLADQYVGAAMRPVWLSLHA